MGQLTRENLLTKEQLKVEKVEFENGDFVYVTEMTALAKDNFENSMLKKKVDADGNVTGFEQITEQYRAKLAVCTVCDEKGVLLFNKEEYNKLAACVGAKKLEKIVDAASVLNAITKADKDILVKNSKPDPDVNSNSGSVEK
jgi:hypothetical protein